MKSISPKAHFRQRVIKYSVKNGVTAASIRYKISRKAIYTWKARYDGKSWRSLDDRSHRPHSHPWTIVNKMDKKMCTKRKNKELQPD